MDGLACGTSSIIWHFMWEWVLACLGCLLLAIAKWMARRDMFLPRAIPKPRICAQRGLVTTRQSRGILPTSRHPNIHCDTSQLVQHPGNPHFPRPGSADAFDVLSQPSIRRRLLTSRHPKKLPMPHRKWPAHSRTTSGTWERRVKWSLCRLL